MPKLLFVGTRGEVEEYRRGHRYHSSMMVILDNGKRILIDYGEESPPLEKLNPDAIVITHAHPDHCGGLEGKEITIPVYMTPFTDKLLDPEHYPMRDRRVIRCGREYDIYGLKVTPHRVYHSVKAPTVGLLLRVGDKKIWYCSDYLHLKDYTRILDGVDIWIGDGSSVSRDLIRVNERYREPFGHSSLKTQIRQAERVGCKLFIVTHLGKEAIEDYTDRELRKELETEKVKVIVARDGKEIDLSEELSTVTTEDIEPLLPTQVDVERIEPVAGIYLVEPHGRYIWQGVKTAILKSRRFKKYIGEPLYLIEDSVCYGVIQLDEPEVIESKKRFVETQYRHLVSDRERKEWWKGKFPLYLYPVRVLKLFPKPKRVVIPRGVQTFISLENIVFEDEMTRLIRDWRTYRARDQPDDVLRDDWRIAIAWYRTLTSRRVPFRSKQFRDLTLEEQIRVVKKLLKDIHDEMVRRGWNPKPLEEILRFTPPESLADITPEYLDSLSDEELLELHKWLHEVFNKWLEER